MEKARHYIKSSSFKHAVGVDKDLEDTDEEGDRGEGGVDREGSEQKSGEGEGGDAGAVGPSWQEESNTSVSDWSDPNTSKNSSCKPIDDEFAWKSFSSKMENLASDIFEPRSFGESVLDHLPKSHLDVLQANNHSSSSLNLTPTQKERGTRMNGGGLAGAAKRHVEKRKSKNSDESVSPTSPKMISKPQERREKREEESGSGDRKNAKLVDDSEGRRTRASRSQHKDMHDIDTHMESVPQVSHREIMLIFISIVLGLVLGRLLL